MKKRARTRGGFSIKQVSEITGVPVHTIRFWEKDFQDYLTPARTSGGHRRYNRKDIDVLNRIKQLRYEDKLTVPGAIEELAGVHGLAGKIERIVDEIAVLIKARVQAKVETERPRRPVAATRRE